MVPYPALNSWTYASTTATASSYTTAGTVTIPIQWLNWGSQLVQNTFGPSVIGSLVPTPVTIPSTWQIDDVDDGYPARLPPPLEFNKFINASDLLEDFIAFLGQNSVRQGEVLKLPLDLFVKWLIIKAAEQDGEPAPVVLQLPAPKAKPRCLGCGQFSPANMATPFHGERCAHFYYSRVASERR